MGCDSVAETKSVFSEIIRQKIKEYRLMDDAFFSEVFRGDTEAASFLLCVILDRSDLNVIQVDTQAEYKNAARRSVRLDIRAVDAAGQIYDIEIQKSDDGALPQRTRYYSGMIDSELLDKNDPFSALGQTYVIFITENDYFSAGCPIYHIERCIKELNDAYFGDGSHILYVNGAFRDATHPIGRLMHDFHCMTAEDMFYPVFAERVHYFKETERGYQTMSRVTEELMEIGRMEAFYELYTDQRISKNEFAAYVGISVDEVDSFIKEKISIYPRSPKKTTNE